MYKLQTSRLVWIVYIHSSLCQIEFLPLLLPFRVVHPAFHCVLSVLDSASEGTGRSVLLAPDLALSVREEIWNKKIPIAPLCLPFCWLMRRFTWILCNPSRAVSFLPLPADGWQPWCRDTSWWPGPLCLNTALTRGTETQALSLTLQNNA